MRRHAFAIAKFLIGLTKRLKKEEYKHFRLAGIDGNVYSPSPAGVRNLYAR